MSSATDLRGVSAAMDAKCKTHEMREKSFKERTQKARDRIVEARRKLSIMHEKRADKQFLIERAEFKTKQIENRLQTIEQRIEQTRQGMRISPNSSDVLMTAQKQLKDSFMKQSELHAKIIRGMRRKDALEKHLHAVQDKGARYRERMKIQVDRLKYSVGRQEEIKKSITDKVANLKNMHGQIMGLEPKLREAHTRMRRIEVVVFELEDKINRKEDDIRRLHKESIYKREEAQRATTEFDVKSNKNYKGSAAMIHLTHQ